ncbi:MAG TPA: hypothetical protein VF753_16865 [Terriglobales bacterium]
MVTVGAKQLKPLTSCLGVPDDPPIGEIPTAPACAANLATVFFSIAVDVVGLEYVPPPFAAKATAKPTAHSENLESGNLE